MPQNRAVPRSVDVARLAGVSQKTVSRVFNDEPYVSDDVRRRVLDAARELGFRLNSAARSLASGRTRTIGVVTLGTALYGPASLFAAVERAVRAAGYGLSVVNTVEGEPDGVPGAVELLLDRGVDGIVVSEPIEEGEGRVGTDVPILVIGAPPSFTAPRVLTVQADARAMARAVTEHLLDLGHPTVHHLAGPAGWYSARDRLDGWRAALEARGLTPPEVLEGDWSAASGHALGRGLAADPSVGAVFAANDEMAIGVIRALTEAGRRVPEDVSVAGFDDVPIAAYLNPPLTTVRQPFDAVAREGLALLLHAIENPGTPPPSPPSPAVDLVVRASTAPPHP